MLNEKFESLFEIDRSKDLRNELDFPISGKEVTEATKKLKNDKSSGSDSILVYIDVFLTFSELTVIKLNTCQI